MQHNSKINTILLIILIVLVGFSLWKIYTIKDKDISLGRSSTDVLSEKNNSEPKFPIKDAESNPSKELQKISLGQEFNIKHGEQVIISDSYGATFKLTGFYNNPCPTNAMCIWSGLDIFYEIQLPVAQSIQKAQKFIKNQPQQNTTQFPFYVIVKNSDYKTYASIVLQGVGHGN